jgi:hypothetical protein
MGMERLWKHVTNEWFYTKSAVWVFSISAALVVLSMAFGWSLEFVPESARDSLTRAFANPSLTAQLGFGLTGISLGLARLVVFVGMFRFWAVCDRSSRMARRIWFVIMIVGFVGISFGTALYCFAVYVPQVLANSARQSQGVGV